MGSTLLLQEALLFTYFLDCTDRLKLRDLINRIDVINAFLLILIALMNSINSNRAGLTIGAWLFPFANQHDFRSGFFKQDEALPTGCSVV